MTEASKQETVYDLVVRISADQRQRDADRAAMADEIVEGQRITTVEEGKRFAKAWIVTAAQHAANEEYYRGERDKLLRATPANAWLQDQWTQLTEPRVPEERWTWRILETLYTEPHRAYHNLDHIEACLRAQVEWARGARTLGDFSIIALALFFHDAVYVPGDKRNEVLSAGLLRAVGPTLRFSETDVERAALAVLATQHHETVADDAVAQVVVDIDLSILGAAPVDYDSYVTKLRREYAAVSDEAWRVGRGGFLAGMLARPGTIFKTAWGVETFEKRARENLAREQASLA
jgi:predicted metal-dependent HD superfamily phosphohydrolase